MTSSLDKNLYNECSTLCNSGEVSSSLLIIANSIYEALEKGKDTTIIANTWKQIVEDEQKYGGESITDQEVNRYIEYVRSLFH